MLSEDERTHQIPINQKQTERYNIKKNEYSNWKQGLASWATVNLNIGSNTNRQKWRGNRNKSGIVVRPTVPGPESK